MNYPARILEIKFMPIIDVIMTVIISGFVFYGFFFGLIRTLGNFLGMIIGAIIASRFYLLAYDWVEPIFFGRGNLGKIIVFIVLFVLINRLVGFSFYLIDKIFKIISIIPFLKTFNRLGGAVLGFVTGGLFLGLILFVISRYSLLESVAGRWLTESKLAPLMLKFVDIIMPLLPEMLKKLQSLI